MATSTPSTSLVVAHGHYQPYVQLSAWETAKARFLNGLEPAERALFDTATPENLLYTTSNLQRQDAIDSKTRKTFDKLHRITSAIDSYGKVIDTYAQISPLHVAPIWGSIRVVLILANKHAKFHSTMVDTLERIGDILPQFG